MSRIHMSTIREFSKEELEEKIIEMRSELRKYKVSESKGTLRKESGKIKPIKKDIARMMTYLNEIKNKEKEEQIKNDSKR